MRGLLKVLPCPFISTSLQTLQPCTECMVAPSASCPLGSLLSSRGNCVGKTLQIRHVEKDSDVSGKKKSENRISHISHRNRHHFHHHYHQSSE